MAKLDWTRVKGYRGDMTAEERISLLDAEDALPEPSGMVAQADFDKVSGELAEVKRQLRAKQTDDEARAQAEAEQRASMEAELSALRRDRTLAGHKAAFLSLGYDEQLAARAAESLTDGKTEDVFAAMGEHRAAAERTMRDRILGGTPVPPAGDGAPPDDADLRAALGL